MLKMKAVPLKSECAKAADAANVLIEEFEKDPGRWYALLAERVEATDETGEHWLLPPNHPVRIWQEMRNWQPVIQMRVIAIDDKPYFI
jgi:hypothetical protein